MEMDIFLGVYNKNNLLKIIKKKISIKKIQINVNTFPYYMLELLIISLHQQNCNMRNSCVISFLKLKIQGEREIQYESRLVIENVSAQIMKFWLSTITSQTSKKHVTFHPISYFLIFLYFVYILKSGKKNNKQIKVNDLLRIVANRKVFSCPFQRKYFRMQFIYKILLFS